MFTIASFTSIAQDLHKNDPGYHINNYKHLNKAAHAAKKNTKTINISQKMAVNTNYKQMGTKTLEKSLEIIRNEPREVYLIRHNYKMPFNTFKRAEEPISIKTDTINNIENTID